ncbi:TetR/AcrR family transcriptional regulator [Henriciella mobilis]|uniref:TetR/AcrR family transcriptional regulator n=1 Tax=Henriciella mobilis TaxID=2305467 RepID=UPI000E664845|nr:TetR/AcrR family transcriptional regulator [Henriciella mobilis]RIJ15394.1 TetR/AcrR family transcriptional regulator [Henriciella mobilis]RIJ18858.1 TetR/AcrR family transcriptional regulator [Henriciella mobilis]
MPPPANNPPRRGAKPKIERAALKLFVDEGVDAATTRQIANQAGVSEGALYRHYKGKDELALALFMETHNRLGEMLSEALSHPGSVEERIHRAVSSYCGLADEDWLLFSFHLVSLNRFLPHDTRREDDPLTRIETILAAMMSSGDIPKSDPALVTAMCLGVITQAGQNKIYNRLPGPFSAHVDAFTRAILAILFQK